MSNLWVRQLLLLILVGTTIAGCATVVPRDSPVPTRALVGVIRIVAGTNVFLNGSLVPSGTSVFDGDRVSTGAGSRAIVEFPGRGFVQFDENTDPYIGFLQEGACVLVRAFRIGQLFAQGQGICVQDEWGMGVLLVLGSINWQIVGGRSTLTVTDGTAQMLRPGQMTLQRGQQVTAVDGVLTTGVVTLPEPELRAVTRWRAALASMVVPELVGRHVDDARRTLKDAGLSVREIEQFTGRARADTVLRQSPRAGDQVGPGTVVDIWVEAAKVDVTPDVARIIMDTLNAVSDELNKVVLDLNARNYEAAATRIKRVRGTFENLERRFQSVGAGAGPLQRLYELAVANRDLQRGGIALIESAISQARRKDMAAYNKSIIELNRGTARFNVNMNEMIRILRTLR